SGCLGGIGLLGRNLLLGAGWQCAFRRIRHLPRKHLRCNQEDEGNRRSSCHSHGHSSQPAAEVQRRGGDSGTFASVFVLILFAASKDTKNTVKQTFFLFVFVGLRPRVAGCRVGPLAPGCWRIARLDGGSDLRRGVCVPRRSLALRPATAQYPWDSRLRLSL